MSKVRFDISMSLDGYVAGPDPRPDAPLGDGGEELHEWAFDSPPGASRTASRAERPTPPRSSLTESLAAIGAYVMGRNMFGGARAVG